MNLKNIFVKPPYLVYKHFFRKRKEGTSFIIFLFFILTFISARLYVYLAMKNIIPDSLVQNIRGVHIHHFAWGILLNSFVGYLSIVIPREYFSKLKMKLAAIFGIGLGLTFDEFGMWARLRDDYLLRQGYDAIVFVSVILINVIYFGNLWKKLISKTLHEFGIK